MAEITFELNELKSIKTLLAKLEEIIRNGEKLLLSEFSITLRAEQMRAIYVTEILETCEKLNLHVNIYRYDEKVEIIISK